MKKLISPVIWLVMVQFPGIQQPMLQQRINTAPAKNLFIITLDGFRWQELFGGADSAILFNNRDTPDVETMKLLYWDQTPLERRKKLMPFFWNVIAVKGQIYGNRYWENKVDVANLYSLSYPGYNEMLTGSADHSITSNKKVNNPNITVLEYLNNKAAFNGKIAVFSSWDVFPFILNTDRSKLPVNSGYNFTGNFLPGKTAEISAIKPKAAWENAPVRDDILTFLTAKEYIRNHFPRVLFLGLGETDEHAHDGRYDLYLQQATQADRIIAELWHWVQTTPGYKDNTAFLITTDHGRGSHPSRWTSHGGFTRGASSAWFALMGPGIKPEGELKEPQQLYLGQLAGIIAGLLGEEFGVRETRSPVSPVVSAW